MRNAKPRSLWQVDIAALGAGAAGCPSDPKVLKLSIEVFDDASGRTAFMVPTDSFVPAVQ